MGADKKEILNHRYEVCGGVEGSWKKWLHEKLIEKLKVEVEKKEYKQICWFCRDGVREAKAQNECFDV